MDYRIRRSLFLFALLVILIQYVSPGQTGNGCSCPNEERTTRRLTICYAGQDCEVDVTYCNARFNPASTTVTCSGMGAAVDMYTKIQSICMVPGSCVFLCEQEDILDAVLCELNPLGGDYFGVKPSIPDCGSYQAYFCWVVAIPRCMRQFQPGLCLETCTDECCIKHYRYCKDPVLGTYNGFLYADCTFGNSNCLPNDCLCGLACYDWDPKSCPTCP